MSMGYFRDWIPLYKEHGGIGISDDKLERHKFMDAEIMWEKMNLTRMHPGLYRVECKIALKCKMIQIPKNGLWVRDISFDIMDEVLAVLPPDWDPRKEKIYSRYYFMDPPPSVVGRKGIKVK